MAVLCVCGYVWVAVVSFNMGLRAVDLGFDRPAQPEQCLLLISISGVHAYLYSKFKQYKKDLAQVGQSLSATKQIIP